jgi:hypothetical protein
MYWRKVVLGYVLKDRNNNGVEVPCMYSTCPSTGFPSLSRSEKLTYLERDRETILE